VRSAWQATYSYEAVMIAGLTRALARACHRQLVRGDANPEPRQELLIAAKWDAARYGLGADLIDVAARRTAPAREVIQSFLVFLRPILEDDGEWDEVSGLVHETCARGGEAARQREAFRRSGRLEDVVDLVVAETARGIA
jgi:carboxylate-amine ligase